ncbi:MAG: hypothetical protein IKT76_02895 [Bacteroides sp.]|nr:hypothetical protein [Bacteroides sp.]
MTNESASKIKFMECRMSGQPYKFVLQLTELQFLFQVLEFSDMEQYKQFAAANDKTGMPYIQVGSRMIALRLSACMQEYELRQDKVAELTRQYHEAIQGAAKWYDEFLSEKEKEGQ